MTINHKARLLVVLSRERERQRIQKLLAEGMKSYVMDAVYVSEGEKGLELLKRRKFDICLYEADHRGLSLADFIHERRRLKNACPVLALMRTDNPEQAHALMVAGAVETLALKNLTSRVLDLALRFILDLERHKRLHRVAVEEKARVGRDHSHLLSAITSILIGVDLEGRITLWNKIAEQVFGLKASAVMDKKLYQCRLNWERERVREAVQECIQEKKQVRLDNLKLMRPGGEEVMLGFTLSPGIHKSSRQHEVLLIGADITERIRSTEKLKAYTKELETMNIQIAREKAKDEAILASVGDGLIVTDPAGHILLVNNQARMMFHWNKDDFAGRMIHDLVPLAQEDGKVLPREEYPSFLALDQKKKIMCFASCLNGGHELPVQVTSSPVLFDKGIIGIVSIFRDVTREKEVENMKSEFVSTVSHELRTPLTSIREGIAQVFEELLGPVNKDQREFLGIALEEVDRLTAIINDLLDISKIEAGKMVLRKTWVEFKDLIQPVLFHFSNLAKNKKLKLTVNFPADDMVEAYCDADKMKQIITNLLTNAYKFTPENGHITLSIENSADEILVCVSDTGVGISAENLPKLFEKFLQVGRTAGPGIKGTGLGLAICKNLVEMHKGRIWVESEAGKGSRFKFTLPRLGKDDAAQENIEQGLGELRQDSTLALIMLKLAAPSKPVRKQSEYPPQKILKTFISRMSRGPMNGIGDLFLNGANECIAIFPGFDKPRAIKMGQNLQESLEKIMESLLKEKDLNYDIEIGVSCFPDDAETSAKLLSKARVAIDCAGSGSERRIAHRARYDMEIKVNGADGREFRMNTVDISEGGLQLYGDTAHPVGEMVTVNMFFPDAVHPVSLKAVIVWSTEDQNQTCLMGAKFVEMTEATRCRIIEFIRNVTDSGSEDGPMEKSA